MGFGIVQPGVSAGLVSANGVPGRTDGAAIAAGYVGEVLGTAVAATGANSYKFTSTTASTIGGATLFTQTLNKGVYLVSALALTTKANNANTDRVIVAIKVAGTTLADSTSQATNIASQLMQAQVLAPVVITADGTSLTITGTTTSDNGGGSGNTLFVVRVA